MKTYSFLLFAFMIVSETLAQSPVPAEKINVNELMEDYFPSSEEGPTDQEIPDELIRLQQSPMNINRDDLSILISYNLLTSFQLKEITSHREKFGDLLATEELQLIPSMNKASILLLRPYLVFDRSQNAAESRQQLIIRYQQKLENAGNDYYTGGPQKILVRYKGIFSNKFSAALLAEKDQGEEIFSGYQKKGVDFYSFHLQYEPEWGKIKKIIAGDFKLSYGQGLVCWSGLGLGNTSAVSTYCRSGQGIQPYTSSDENKFNRGLALSASVCKIQTDVWLSHHLIDGSIMTGNSGEKSFSSFQTSGYHRTYSEQLNRHSISETYSGFALQKGDRLSRIGVIVTSDHFDIRMKKADDPYKLFSFEGKQNSNASFFYYLVKKNILFSGENAISSSGGLAFINSILISMDPKISVILLHRNYTQDFHSFKGDAFGMNSMNAGEYGLLSGFTFKVNTKLSLSGIADIYRFPFLKYRVNTPSDGKTANIQADYIPNKKISIQLRFRSHMKMQNGNSENNFYLVEKVMSNVIRFNMRMKVNDILEYGVRGEYNTISRLKEKNLNGYMLSQDLVCHFYKKKINVSIRYAMFSCEDFESRIYHYESDLPGAFSSPFYYGNGEKIYINANCRISRQLTLSAKYSLSKIKEKNPVLIITSSEIKFQAGISF
jgi:hypothetical protein